MTKTEKQKITQIYDIIKYLETHNKNYNQKQFYAIIDIRDLLKEILKKG